MILLDLNTRNNLNQMLWFYCLLVCLLLFTLFITFVMFQICFVLFNEMLRTIPILTTDEIQGENKVKKSQSEKMMMGNYSD